MITSEDVEIKKLEGFKAAVLTVEAPSPSWDMRFVDSGSVLRPCYLTNTPAPRC